MASELGDLLKDSIDRMLTDRMTPALSRRAEDGEWPADLWALLEANGFAVALVSEGRGGSGLRWDDVYSLVHAAGRHALPLPLPEALLAAWLMDSAGLDPVGGPVTIGDADAVLRGRWSGERLHIDGRVDHVAWGRTCGHLLVEVEAEGTPVLALIALDGIVPAATDLNVAREPRDAYAFDAVAAVVHAPIPAALGRRPIRRYGALLRVGQMAGAAERIAVQSVQYALERSQFGKPIGQFQAIQQQLAVLGCEVAAVSAAARFAFATAHDDRFDVAVAAAKIRAGEAVGKIASIAHAVHGAIGFTYEHTLHFATRRLWSWRSEHGSASWWAERLGRAACRHPDDYWACVTDTRLPLDFEPENPA